MNEFHNSKPLSPNVFNASKKKYLRKSRILVVDETSQKYEEIMAAIDLDTILYEINKKSRFGAPTELSETNIFQNEQETIILGDTVAIDATHFEACDKSQSKREKLKAMPKKRGRKKKEEREQWLIEQAEREANLSLYEKKIEDQLDVLSDRLRAEIPKIPSGVSRKIVKDETSIGSSIKDI